jgi:hypothetical protein
VEKEGGKRMAKYLVKVYDPVDNDFELFIHYIKDMNKALYLSTRWSYANKVENAKIFTSKTDAKKIIKLLKSEKNDLVSRTSEYEILEVIVVKNKIFIEKGRY